MKAITLLTDFGLKDAYVGTMKGVILSIAPNTYIVDITHEISPQDIVEAAFTIEGYYRFFPKGTIHIAVVDPNVGSERLPIVVCKDGYIFVGPDNGIFSLILKGERDVYIIENSHFMLREISNTFHGRDVFSPAAAYIASGVPPSRLGPSLNDPVILKDLHPEFKETSLIGRIVKIDRYGNAVTNIGYHDFNRFVQGRGFTVRIGDMVFPNINRSYYENEFVCLFGSSNYLEFGRYMGNFSETKNIKKGDQVTIELK
ncbi:MAG: SAM-dependent chlorinase/fluorinase [Syntrophorhabdaceae bacterium]|nr:SAM-dependent chlorinase/fluorinase [Syntrophorhabdaceae bacterium]